MARCRIPTAARHRTDIAEAASVDSRLETGQTLYVHLGANTWQGRLETQEKSVSIHFPRGLFDEFRGPFAWRNASARV